MAVSWPVKAPTAVREYTWTPNPAIALNSASAVVTSGTATIVAEVQGADVVFTVSGGTDGAAQVFTATATSGDLTFVQTFYLAIEATTNRIDNTVEDVCSFALRKIAGIGNTPDATMTADAVERLNDMVALWRVTGADIGIALPLTEASDLPITDNALLAIKLNLRNELHDFYGAEVTPDMVMKARAALAAVKNGIIPRREPEYF